MTIAADVEGTFGGNAGRKFICWGDALKVLGFTG